MKIVGAVYALVAVLGLVMGGPMLLGLVAVWSSHSAALDGLAVGAATLVALVAAHLGVTKDSVYRWIEREFGAHAMVPVGKHGNLEWLPGKTVGMSAACGPDAALGDLLAYDRQNNADLVSTLDAFFAANGSPKEAAVTPPRLES